MIQIEKKAELRGHNGAVYCLSRFRESHQLISAAGDGWMVLWDLRQPKDGKLLATIQGNIFSLCPILEKNWLLAGDMYGGLHWADLDKKVNFRSAQLHQKGIYDIQLIEDKIFSIGGDGSVARWDVEKARSIDSLQLSVQSLRCLAYAPERKEIAIGSSDNSIYIMDSDTFTLKHRILNAHQNSVFSLAYHPEKRYLLSGGRDAYLRIWDLENNYKELPTQAAHLFTVNAIAFHPNKPLFATASRDKTIKIWDAQQFSLLKVIDTVRNGGHLNSVNSLYWSDFDTGQLISCSDDKTLMVWAIDNEPV